MTDADIATCAGVIQPALYPPDLQESELPYLHRFRGYPPGCFVAVDDEDRVVAYGQSHPWHLARPPSVTVPEDALERIPPPHAPLEGMEEGSYHPHYFIFDISTLVQRRGVGEALLSAILHHAVKELGYREIRLVAVRGAHTYWARFGFEEIRRIEPGGGYGQNLAVYMVRRVADDGGKAAATSSSSNEPS